jgi:hypothetical protein
VWRTFCLDMSTASATARTAGPTSAGVPLAFTATSSESKRRSHAYGFDSKATQLGVQ